MNILDKILQLRDKLLGESNPNRHQNERDILSWEKKAKKSLLILSLKDHKGFQYVLDNLAVDIKNITDQLQNLDSTKLPDTQRDRLLDKKKMYTDFINIFINAEKDLESLDKKVEENLNSDII